MPQMEIHSRTLTKHANEYVMLTYVKADHPNALQLYTYLVKAFWSGMR